jgi:hypothetical protein
MANSPGIAEFVIYFTVLAQKMAQYPAGNCRGKTMQVSGLVLYTRIHHVVLRLLSILSCIEDGGAQYFDASRFDGADTG